MDDDSNENALLVLLSTIVEHEGGEYRVPLSARQALMINQRALEVYVDDNDDMVLTLVDYDAPEVNDVDV